VHNIIIIIKYMNAILYVIAAFYSLKIIFIPIEGMLHTDNVTIMYMLLTV